MDTGLEIMRRTAFVLSLLLGVALIVALTLAPFSNAQGRGGFRGGQETAPDLITEFDKNENGRLEADERAAALADLKKNPRSQGKRKGGKGGRKGRGKAALVVARAVPTNLGVKSNPPMSSTTRINRFTTSRSCVRSLSNLIPTNGKPRWPS